MKTLVCLSVCLLPAAPRARWCGGAHSWDRFSVQPTRVCPVACAPRRPLAVRSATTPPPGPRSPSSSCILWSQGGGVRAPAPLAASPSPWIPGERSSGSTAGPVARERYPLETAVALWTPSPNLSQLVVLASSLSAWAAAVITIAPGAPRGVRLPRSLCWPGLPSPSPSRRRHCPAGTWRGAGAWSQTPTRSCSPPPSLLLETNLYLRDPSPARSLCGSGSAGARPALHLQPRIQGAST